MKIEGRLANAAKSGGNAVKLELDAIQAEVAALRGGGVKGGEPLLWGSWRDYPKATMNGREYAQIGNRLYTEHAVNRMQPSGLGAPAGELSPGRNVSPTIVDEVIRTGQPTHTVVDGVARAVYWRGNVGVVTEGGGNLVVTILRRGTQ